MADLGDIQAEEKIEVQCDEEERAETRVNSLPALEPNSC